MQVNQGIFATNGQCGFLLKPECMRKTNRNFDPFIDRTVDDVVPNSITVRVMSGQLLSTNRISTFVEVEMYGLAADTVRKRFRTRTVDNNGINPQYMDKNTSGFEFPKIVLPDMAYMRFVVYDDANRNMIGHCIYPVTGINAGYRHLCLKNAIGQPLGLATLFVHFSIKIFVPEVHSDFADALANPIAYLKVIDKRNETFHKVADEGDIASCTLCPENQAKNRLSHRADKHSFVTFLENSEAQEQRIPRNLATKVLIFQNPFVKFVIPRSKPKTAQKISGLNFDILSNLNSLQNHSIKKYTMQKLMSNPKERRRSSDGASYATKSLPNIHCSIGKLLNMACSPWNQSRLTSSSLYSYGSPECPRKLKNSTETTEDGERIFNATYWRAEWNFVKDQKLALRKVMIEVTDQCKRQSYSILDKLYEK
ncbi:unnamed protein product [Soboliphyme baturini]|uniref:PI-PLC Y-box domain-containing protein n=1 Tax=Soboliphyme baturini TaxID=241478 RepID=A0A183IYX8_9BILA|nr:unnamed protein product [Soboliphyme baturini]